MDGTRKHFAIDDSAMSESDPNKVLFSRFGYGKLMKEKWIMSLDFSQVRARRKRSAYGYSQMISNVYELKLTCFPLILKFKK